MQTEVHVFALSISASVLLSVFPFLIVMMSLCKYGLHWPAGVQALDLALTDFFPGEIGQFIHRNLMAVVQSRGPFQITSLFLLSFTANGVFEPLEVALNRVWGFRNNRSYLGNQLIALGLAFACGSLALLSVALTAGNVAVLKTVLHGYGAWYVRLAGFVSMKICAIAASITIFFLIYWLLPNGKVSPRRVLLPAVILGLLSELLKYAYILALPRLNFGEVYGPFAISVSLMIWAFLSGMLLLTGAHLSAQKSLRDL